MAKEWDNGETVQEEEEKERRQVQLTEKQWYETECWTKWQGMIQQRKGGGEVGGDREKASITDDKAVIKDKIKNKITEE